MTINAAAATSSLVDGLVIQLTISHGSIHRNAEGVSHEESLLRPQPAGNSANWVIGHIVSARNRLLAAFRETLVVSVESMAPYRRGSDGNLESALPLDDLLAALDRSQTGLISGLRRLTESELAAKASFASPAGPDATFGAALVGIVFHEAYHVGQLGVLRRLIGKKGAI